MLTRASIESGSYIKSLEHVPDSIRWSYGQIEDSMASLLAERPSLDDVWLFAYGSLIWNPLTNHAERRPALLDGWHRSFCQKLIAGRAAADTPGRMLGLRAGGTTRGVAYRFSLPTLESELRLVWIREMAMGIYRPIWARATLDDGTEVDSIVFVADERHPFYESDGAVETVAPLIAGATGPWGSNAEYVFSLADALGRDGIKDPYITHLASTVRRCVRNDAYFDESSMRHADLRRFQVA